MGRKNERSVYAFVFQFLFYFLFGFFVLFTIFQLGSSYYFYKNSLKTAKENILKEKKRKLNLAKNNIEDMLDFLYKSKTERIKLTVKQNVYIMASVIDSIVEKMKSNGTSNKEIYLTISNLIDRVKFLKEGYFFIIDSNGNLVMHPYQKDLIGDRTKLKDKHAREILNKFYQIIKSDKKEGYLHYTWIIYSLHKKAFKLSYIKKLNSFNWFLAGGITYPEIESMVKNEFLNLLEITAFKNEQINLIILDENNHFIKKIGSNITKSLSNKITGLPSGFHILKIKEGNLIILKDIYTPWNWKLFFISQLADIPQIISYTRINTIKEIFSNIVIVLLFLLGFYYFLFEKIKNYMELLHKERSLFLLQLQNVLTQHMKLSPQKFYFKEIKEFAKQVNNIITEYFKKTEALERETQRLKIVAENINGFLWYAEIIDENTFKNFYMGRVENIFGYSLEEIKKEKNNTWTELIYKEDKKRFEKLIEELKSGKDMQEEFRIINKNGQIKWILVSASPIRNKEGKIINITGVITDITHRKEMEKKLEQEIKLFQNVLSSMIEGVIITDENKRIIFSNNKSSEILYYPKNEIFFKEITEIFVLKPMDKNKKIKFSFDDVLKSGKSFSSEREFYLKNSKGNYIPTAFNVIPLKVGGEIKGLIIVFRDISESLLIEREIIKKQNVESLGILAAGIAHDFNNQLTSIAANISLIKALAKDNRKILKIIKGLEQALENAKNLSTQLLAFAKGGIPVKSVFCLNKLVEEILEFSLRGKSVEYELKSSTDFFIYADKNQLAQVFSNLIINSCQAMNDKGKIIVTMNKISIDDSSTFMRAFSHLKAGEYVVIKFKDTGPGIPKEILSHIFEPYFTTKEKGTGLGLATVYTIIKNHGGLIYASSEKHEGAIFYIYLPLVKSKLEKKEKIESLQTETEGRKKIKKGTIIIMDDEESVRKVLKDMLSFMGHKVIEASKGEEVIEIYTELLKNGKSVSAIILDLTIKGGMGGKLTAEKLLLINPDLKLIASSGYSNDPIMSNYEFYGFYAVLPKPYTLEDLKKLFE